MRLSKNTLRLVVNPFCAPLDAEGRACALVPTDPSEPSGAKFVGARLVIDAKADVVKRPGNVFGDRVKPRVEYDLRAKDYPDTSYYREKLKSGEVFAAEGAIDKLAAAAIGIFESGVDPRNVCPAWEKQGLKSIVERLSPPEAPTQNSTAGDAPAEETVQ
jgi:hypothetical protein